jgi:D-aspartate ligase
LPPAFLTSAGFFGTLATVRALGRAGISVTVADSAPLAVSKFSRYTSRSLRCPNLRDEGDRFLEWLLAFGKKSAEKHVLLATCDDTAWLYARHAEELSRYFHLDSPPLAALYPLLNKRRLAECCMALGIDIPTTRTVKNESDLQRIEREATVPVLIKPSTQVLFKSRQKGEIVTERKRFAELYRDFAANEFTSSLVAYDSSVLWPLVQDFHADADCIYNLAGYMAPWGEISVVRASAKVLQARKVSVGICFEAAAVEPRLVAAVEELLRSVGYRGVFEIEFIRERNEYLLIDANPRFYGEMAFDVRRGMQLPLLAYFQALGDDAAVRSLVSQSTSTADDAPHVHMHRLGLEMMLQLQRFAGAFSADEAAEWRAWQLAAGPNASDAVLDRDDMLPALIDAAAQLYGQLRHPTHLLRTTLKQRLGKGPRRDLIGAYRLGTAGANEPRCSERDPRHQHPA